MNEQTKKDKEKVLGKSKQKPLKNGKQTCQFIFVLPGKWLQKATELHISLERKKSLFMVRSAHTDILNSNFGIFLYLCRSYSMHHNEMMPTM